MTDDVKALIEEARAFELTTAGAIVGANQALDAAHNAASHIDASRKIFCGVVAERDRLWALCVRLAAALSAADAAGFARGIKEGHVFAEFALRHTHPARAKERTHEETHSILVFHPFAQALNQEQTQ